MRQLTEFLETNGAIPIEIHLLDHGGKLGIAQAKATHHALQLGCSNATAVILIEDAKGQLEAALMIALAGDHQSLELGKVHGSRALHIDLFDQGTEIGRTGRLTQGNHHLAQFLDGNFTIAIGVKHRESPPKLIDLRATERLRPIWCCHLNRQSIAATAAFGSY